MGGQLNMISIEYHSRTKHNYMKEQVASNATIIDDDITMEAISVYEMLNVKFQSDDQLHNYIIFIN